MTDQDKANIAANRATWNETADVHAAGYVQSLKQRIAAPDFTTFDEVEKRIFSQIKLPGKDVVQLSCNNGRELIAVKKAGAGRCVGVDISDKFIAQGEALAEAAGVAIEFICSDLYELDASLAGTFDLVYVTIGAIGWLPELDTYFKLIARLLRPGGQLFMYEMHPVLNMFDAKKGLEVNASYFRTEPFEDEAEPDYWHPEVVVQGKSYWYPHRLADVIGGCLENGLNLTHFKEYAHDISATYAAFETFDMRPPMCFSLLASKRPT